MATKIKYKNINQVQLLIEKKFKDAAKSRDMLKEVGETTVTRVRYNARRGKPANQDGSTREFPTLKPYSIKRRKSIGNNGKNRTHQAFRATRTKSNVTITGQLLDHVRFKIVKGGVIELFIKGSRKLYRGKRGQVLENQEKTSQDVYKKLIELNKRYKFLQIDTKGIERINRIVLKYLRKRLSLKR